MQSELSPLESVSAMKNSFVGAGVFAGVDRQVCEDAHPPALSGFMGAPRTYECLLLPER